MLKNILKKLLLYLSPLILMSVIVFCLYLPSTYQNVMSVAGNENGEFVVALELENTNKGFRIYNNKGKLIRTCLHKISVRIFGKILPMTRQKSAGGLSPVKDF